MQPDPRDICPGSIVKVFDRRLYKDDLSTPLSFTMQKATVLSRYGTPKRSYGEDLELGPYPDCVDVRFHYNNRVSKGHFTNGVEWIGGEKL